MVAKKTAPKQPAYFVVVPQTRGWGRKSTQLWTRKEDGSPRYETSISYTIEEYPGCCALMIISNIHFDEYSQNNTNWAIRGKRFFELYNKDPSILDREISRQHYGNNPFEYLGGVTLAMSYKAVEKSIVDQVIAFFNKNMSLNLQPNFTVQSNHGRYPVIQFTAVKRAYKKQTTEVEAIAA